MCLALPEAYQEEAWAGTRWCVRKKNFAARRDDRRGLATRVRAGGRVGRAARGDDVPFVGAGAHALTEAGHPFFKPVWFSDIVGMVLDSDTDWPEVAELLTESYCLLAPKKLVERVDRGPG